MLVMLVMLNDTLHKVEDHENHVTWIYLPTVLYMGVSQKYVRKDVLTWCSVSLISTYLLVRF